MCVISCFCSRCFFFVLPCIGYVLVSLSFSAWRSESCVHLPHVEVMTRVGRDGTNDVSSAALPATAFGAIHDNDKNNDKNFALSLTHTLIHAHARTHARMQAGQRGQQLLVPRDCREGASGGDASLHGEG